ncbi:septum formation initiator family protein [Clostridium botulinum]|uniref:Septum formation initiator superfamily n=1 Tax=Clostridium botulinum D str. 1873 TaxID=592027 RepID=A0A9P2LLT8_CLOBO|nr:MULTISPECIES: septum formation initiator family protein [Clostridium]AYF53818.1 dihydroorotate dehydrogenase [Clostridium novyi]EES91944.1 septum formation initiator superfamily [Clostridium botulinum D str. 1873]MBO3442286.1 septum formation initiator family protein [Clostridium haemolyticum]MCD3216619.1 septum formation initiator family protein [Clostridium botulinum C]MCD3245780.1 septum formation initiator family protein [Clostridium botulinum C]
MKNKSKIKVMILTIIIIYACYILVHQQMTIKNKKIQLENCKIELQKVNDQHQRLLDTIKMSETNRYVEQLARERLGFLKQGETVVVNKKD